MRRKNYQLKKFNYPMRPGPYRIYNRVDLSDPNNTVLEILFNTENKEEAIYLKISIKKEKGKYIHGNREKGKSVYQASVEYESVGTLTEDQLAKLLKGEE